MKHRLSLCREGEARKCSTFSQSDVSWGTGSEQCWQRLVQPLHLPAAPSAALRALTPSWQQKTPFPYSIQGDFITWCIMQITGYNTYNDTNSRFKPKRTRKPQRGGKSDRLFHLFSSFISTKIATKTFFPNFFFPNFLHKHSSSCSNWSPFIK